MSLSSKFRAHGGTTALLCFPPFFLFWVRVNGLQCDLLVTGTCRRRQSYHLEEGKKNLGGKKREEKRRSILVFVTTTYQTRPMHRKFAKCHGHPAYPNPMLHTSPTSRFTCSSRLGLPALRPPRLVAEAVPRHGRRTGQKPEGRRGGPCGRPRRAPSVSCCGQAMRPMRVRYVPQHVPCAAQALAHRA